MDERLKRPATRGSYVFKTADAAMVRWADAHQSGVFSDLGWQGSVLGGVIDYQGPPPRGGADQSNAGQVREIDRLRHSGVGEALLTHALLIECERVNSQATLALRHSYTREGTKRQQANAMSIDYDYYKLLIQTGIHWLGLELIRREKRSA